MTIMITLRQIRDKCPCGRGWKTILAARGGENADLDAPFPLADAIDSNGFDDALLACRCLPDQDNLWRLFAVWCARRVQHLMRDPRSLAALDVAERHARGKATDEELNAARNAAWAAASAAALKAARAEQESEFRRILECGTVEAAYPEQEGTAS